MKKNELVHLHALLACVASDYVNRRLATPADFEPYSRLGVSPTTVTAPRDDHQRAVGTLAAILAERSDAAAAETEANHAHTADAEPNHTDAAATEYGRPATGNH